MKPPATDAGRSLASCRRWLRNDLVAGLVLSTLLVTQGMGMRRRFCFHAKAEVALSPLPPERVVAPEPAASRSN